MRPWDRASSVRLVLFIDRDSLFSFTLALPVCSIHGERFILHTCMPVCVCYSKKKNNINLAFFQSEIEKTFWQIIENQRKVKINSVFLYSTSTQFAVFCFVVGGVYFSLSAFWCLLGARQLSSPEQFWKIWDKTVRKTSGGSTYTSRSNVTCRLSQSSATLQAAWCRI